MNLGFTGTREGMSNSQREAFALLILEHLPGTFHHGDCLGADAEAHDIVCEFSPNTIIHIHPPESDYMRAYKTGDILYPKYDYLIRDRNIVDYSDMLVGAPLTDIEQTKSGTWYTIRYSHSIGKPTSILKR